MGFRVRKERKYGYGEHASLMELNGYLVEAGSTD